MASSWRNFAQRGVVERLRAEGFNVYDFKNPSEGDIGFSWKQVNPDYEPGKPLAARDFMKMLEHPRALRGFKNDMEALENCDACVCVWPCGRSAHLELGEACGAGKYTAVLLDDPVSEPELMIKMCNLYTPSLDEIVEALRKQ